MKPKTPKKTQWVGLFKKHQGFSDLPCIIVLVTCDCRHHQANISAAERVKLFARGRADVAGTAGDKPVDRCRQGEVTVVKAHHVSNKKGFCEICKVHLTDMKAVG